MPLVKKIEARMVPAVESRLTQPSVGDILSVPAVTVFIDSGQASISCTGLIDTGADMCVLDETVFGRLGDQAPKVAQKVLASGFSRKHVSLYQLELRVRGESVEQEMRFHKVPVAVCPLHRPILIVGGRGGKQFAKFALREKLLALSQVMDLSGTAGDIDTVIMSRNIAAHSPSDAIGQLSPELFLAAAERLVSRLSANQNS